MSIVTGLIVLGSFVFVYLLCKLCLKDKNHDIKIKTSFFSIEIQKK